MKKITWSFGIALIFGLLLTSCTELSQVGPKSEHALEKNDEFEIVWSVQGINMYTSKQRPLVISSKGKFIVEGWDGDQDLSIFAFDSLNGNMLWQTPLNSNTPGYIISHANVIYRGSFGAAVVQAFDVNDGKQIWKVGLPFAHSTSEIYFAEDKIFIFTSDNMFFILNKQGEILNMRHESFATYLEKNNVLYVDENNSLKAIDVASRKELWQIQIDDRFTHSPIFEKGTIFLRTWTTPGYVYSIDQVTGKVNWKVSQDVLSNLALSDNSIYFINFDGYLMALDLYSGEVIAEAKFLPQFDLENGVERFFISVDATNNMLLIYFGDNSQTLGVKILDP